MNYRKPPSKEHYPNNVAYDPKRASSDIRSSSKLIPLNQLSAKWTKAELRNHETAASPRNAYDRDGHNDAGKKPEKPCNDAAEN
jgi:hypothetical protein